MVGNEMSAKREQLGAILVRHGLITPEQLDEALEAQVIFGGRLGTNLVDLGFLSVDEIGRFLSAQHGVPTVGVEELFAVSPQVLGLLTPEQCTRYKVYPLSTDGKVIRMAMMDPHDLIAIDELTFLTDLLVQNIVVPELRLLQILEKRYGIRREKRFLRVPTEGTPQRPEPAQGEPLVPPESQGRISSLFPAVEVTPAPSEEEQEEERGEVGAGPDPFQEEETPRMELVFLDDAMRRMMEEPDDFEVVVAEPERDREGTHTEVVDLPPSVAEAGPVEGGEWADSDAETAVVERTQVDSLPPVFVQTGVGAEQLPPTLDPFEIEQTPNIMDAEAIGFALDNAQDRDTVVSLLVQPLRSQAATRSALFLVRGEMAVGLAVGPNTDLPNEEIKGLVLPLVAPSSLRRAVARRKVVIGNAHKDPLQQVISRYLHWPEPEEVCIAPVSHGKRVINLLCIQTASGTRFTTGFAEEIKHLCDKAAAAYVRLIRRHKRPDTLPPVEKREDDAHSRAPGGKPQLQDDRYFVTQRIGAEPAATVWRAVDTRSQKVVAIKLMQPGVLDTDDILRLARDVEALQRLRHPCIARLIDTGVSKEGDPYVVMDWLEGIDLREKLDSGPISQLEAMNITLQICSALLAAHDRDVIHRNLSPENVLLLAPEHLSVRVINFGMTKSRLRLNKAVVKQIEQGFFGLVEYIAPERLRGSTTTPAVDVYSAATVAYEAFAGHRPFEGIDSRQVVDTRVSLKPRPMSNTPPHVEKIIMQGLSEDPKARPTIKEMAQELTRGQDLPSKLPG
jgi:hypothetical protein